MKRILLIAAVFIGWIIAGQSDAQTPQPQRPAPQPQPKAAQPAPGKDTLPPPQELPMIRAVPPLIIVHRPTLGERAVWENYSVNSRGQMVPRIVMAPGGYYYSANGQPYPWSISASRVYMPLVSD